MTASEWFGSDALRRGFERALDDFSGEVGFYAKNLTTGDEAGFRADAIMPTASVIKVGIMAELYRRAGSGEIDLDERIVVQSHDWTGGTGILKEMQPGIAPTVADLCRLMIILSDNVATGILVGRLGKDQINASLREWGLPTTELVWELAIGDSDIRKYAVSSPRDLGRLYELIATDAIVSPAACEAMRYHLSRQQHLEQIPRGLPYNVFAGDLGRDQPVRVMNKIGNYEGVRVDAALIEAPGVRFIVVTMNEGSAELGFAIDQEGNRLNGRLGRMVFDAWVAPDAIPAEVLRHL
jgi:beta-lactamase class A